MKTNELLDAVKARYKLPSDYALAAKLGMTRAGISGYRKGRTKLGEEAALKAAELLDMDAGYVLACIEAERTQSEAARAEWQRLADRVKPLGVAAVYLLLAAAPYPTQWSAAFIDSGVCILCKLRRLIVGAASSLGAWCRSGFHAHPVPV